MIFLYSSESESSFKVSEFFNLVLGGKSGISGSPVSNTAQASSKTSGSIVIEFAI